MEQKNGAVVRRLVGYGRLEGVAAGETLARLYSASRLFVNVFQPSFKLAEKTREGARVRKRYHAPETPCARLLASDAIPAVMKQRLGALLGTLDPLGLLDEIRTVQHHLAALAAGATVHPLPQRDAELDRFLRSLAVAWRAGEVRPTHQPAAKAPRWWRTRRDPFETTWPRVVQVAGGGTAAYGKGALRPPATGTSGPVCSGSAAHAAAAGQGLAPTRGPPADPRRSAGIDRGCS